MFERGLSLSYLPNESIENFHDDDKYKLLAVSPSMPIRLSSFRPILLRTAMPVTFKVANHDANSFPCKGMENVEELTKASCYKEWKESGEMLQTSAAEDVLRTLIPYENGLVHTIVEAYGQHRHLTLRYVSQACTCLIPY